jgi:hypothetical protein
MNGECRVTLMVVEEVDPMQSDPHSAANARVVARRRPGLVLQAAIDAMPDEVVDRRHERGQRLARAGGGRDQDVTASLDERPRLCLCGRWDLEVVLEPPSNGGMELHRHRMWWERSDQFDRDNFTPEAARGRDRFLYVPFGAGPRICVGANFAMMQAHIILATLLGRFRFEPGPDPAPRPTMLMKVRPDGGVRLVVRNW